MPNPSNNHADFDAFMQVISKARSCRIYGKTYTGMPDLPFKLGVKLLNVIVGKPHDDGKPPTDEEMTTVFAESLDHAFGAGTFESWTETHGMSAEMVAIMISYVRSGYDAAVLKALIEARETPEGKDAEGNAGQGELPMSDKPSISGTTGPSS